jgi:hypothetical protein
MKRRNSFLFGSPDHPHLIIPTCLFGNGVWKMWERIYVVKGGREPPDFDFSKAQFELDVGIKDFISVFLAGAAEI